MSDGPDSAESRMFQITNYRLENMLRMKKEDCYTPPHQRASMVLVYCQSKYLQLKLFSCLSESKLDWKLAACCIYSTHQAIKNIPLLLRAFLWRGGMARDRIFVLFFSSRRKDDLKIIHTWHFCRMYPHVSISSFKIKNTPFSPHKLSVKTGSF
jgi:hypothetical protein